MTTPPAPFHDLIDVAASASARAFDTWCFSSTLDRAELLTALAHRLDLARETLIRTAMEETCLAESRLRGEFARTLFQLQGFATRLRSGQLIATIEEPEVPGPPPSGHPHLRLVQLGLGPVAMFSASNFPFAFSVLGGDTVAALAAGCPVVVKAHPGHPRLSRAVFAVVEEVLATRAAWAHLVGMVDGASNAVGVALVQHPVIAAVAFTGSHAGGNALFRVAANRPRPIPFYGELGSLNPVLLLDDTLASPGPVIDELVAAITGSSGQLCTSPGLLLVQEGPAARAFVTALTAALQHAPTHPMLSDTMREGFERGVSTWAAQEGVHVHRCGTGLAVECPIPTVGITDARTFITTESLQDEVFGPACLVVQCADPAGMAEVLQAVGGALTVTLRGVQPDRPGHAALVRRATLTAGRVLFAGMPTGVAVAEAQHHGGPWPSTTAPGHTAVGYGSVQRFLRPVAFQSPPAWIDRALGG